MATPQVPSDEAMANQNDELWEEAWVKFQADDSELYDRLQTIIEKDPVVQMGGPQDLGALLARKRRIMEDKQWVLNLHAKAFNIEPIKIGPLFDKIIKVFKVIKPIGDTAAGLDPVHAGIPWACVSVLLPVCWSLC